MLLTNCMIYIYIYIYIYYFVLFNDPYSINSVFTPYTMISVSPPTPPHPTPPLLSPSFSLSLPFSPPPPFFAGDQ